jgi:hypothetical protein
VGFLTNPHFTAGTTLLLLALLLYESSPGVGGAILATVVATALAIVRPYDFVLLVLIRGTCVLLLEPVRRWHLSLAPLLALLPVAGYLYWLFYRNPAFAFYSGTEQGFPKMADFLWALGPAVGLALLGLYKPLALEGPRRARLHLVAWVVFAAVVIALRPVAFSMQFVVGSGVPLLALGALGLARWRPLVSLLTAALFAVSFAAALRFTLTPRPYWLTARETMALVETLRTHCAQGDILMAPEEIGLFSYGLTPCRSFVSHRISPNHERRLREVDQLRNVAPAERLSFLDGNRVRFLVLSGDAGPAAEAWLGSDTGWARIASFGAPARLSLYRRP